MDGLLQSYHFYISVLMMICSGVFATLVLRSWLAKRRPHLLAWGGGLLLYFIASLSQVVLTFMWSGLAYRLWYWAGALMVAPWLGQGTIFLLVRRGSIARNSMMALSLVSLMTFIWMFITPLTPSLPWAVGQDIVVLTDEIMPPFSGSVRAFVPITNGIGTLMLVGGALWSARLFASKQIMQNRVIGNALIALGGVLPASGGYFIRLGQPNYKFTLDLLGVILIFIGYLVATHLPEEVQVQRAQRGERLKR
jgi:hypothetical protein